MPVSLIELAGGGVSLELGAGDFDSVVQVLPRLGLAPPVTLERSALYDVVEVAGERLLYCHEWDPCLLSTSAARASLLRRVYQALLPAGGKPG